MKSYARFPKEATEFREKGVHYPHASEMQKTLIGISALLQLASIQTTQPL